MTERVVTALAIVVAALSFAAAASANAPARWTPAQASAKMRGKCSGVGKGVGKPAKFAAFKCQVGSRVVWAKVRPDGKVLCWSARSLAKVPAYCMTVPGQG